MINPIITKGNITYNDHNNCKNIIRIQKPIREVFPVLKEVNAMISYTLLYPATYGNLFREIVSLIEQEKPLPLLLFIAKEEHGKES